MIRLIGPLYTVAPPHWQPFPEAARGAAFPLVSATAVPWSEPPVLRHNRQMIKAMTHVIVDLWQPKGGFKLGRSGIRARG